MSGLFDRAKGLGKELRGKGKAKAGRAGGDPKLRAEGEADQLGGKGAGMVGRLKTFLARR